jgi:hypothetical protein
MSNPLYIAGLLSQYLPENAITGVLANIDVETGGSFDYTQKQENGPGYGLFQFDYQKPYYFKYLEKEGLNDSAKSQVMFMADAIYNNKSDAEGKYTGALDLGGPARRAIQKSFEEGSAADITKTFSEKYEKPSKPHMKKRLESAEKFESFRGLFTNPLSLP